MTQRQSRKEKKCLYCHDSIPKDKRSDAKFCSLEHQIAYHKEKKTPGARKITKPGKPIMNSNRTLLEKMDLKLDKILSELKDSDIESRHYLTPTEASRFLKINRVTLFRWEKDGKVKSVIIGGKKVFPVEDLKEFLR